MTQVRRGRWAFGLTAGAFAWALAIIPAGFLLPVYGTGAVTNAFPRTSESTAEAPHHANATLIGANGASARLLILLALPALLAVVVWLGLHRACTAGSVAGRRIAATAIGLLAALTLLTGFSIGGEILPVLILLLIARSLTPLGTPKTTTAQR